MTLVIDASVALKLGIAEAGSDRAKALLLRGERLVAPDILVSEVANAIWKKTLIGNVEADAHALVLAASIDIIDELAPSRELVARALELAVALRHPVYDCVYLALAEQRSAVFVSADSRLGARLASAGWSGQFEAL